MFSKKIGCVNQLSGSCEFDDQDLIVWVQETVKIAVQVLN